MQFVICQVFINFREPFVNDKVDGADDNFQSSYDAKIPAYRFIEFRFVETEFRLIITVNSIIKIYKYRQKTRDINQIAFITYMFNSFIIKFQ